MQGHNQQTYPQHYGIGMLKILNGVQNGCQIYDVNQKCSKVHIISIVSPKMHSSGIKTQFIII